MSTAAALPNLQIVDGFTYNYGVVPAQTIVSFPGSVMQVLFVSSPFVPLIFLAYWIWGLISPDQAYATNGGGPAFYMCYFITYNFLGGYVFSVDQTYTYMRELLLWSVISSNFAYWVIPTPILLVIEAIFPWVASIVVLASLTGLLAIVF